MKTVVIFMSNQGKLYIRIGDIIYLPWESDPKGELKMRMRYKSLC